MPRKPHHCQIEGALRIKGLRRTRGRHHLLSLFRPGRAWTIAQLHRSLRGLDLSTAYRNVRALEAKGMVVAAKVGGETYYELPATRHHDHRLCGRCSTAECVPCPDPKLGPHRIELIGLCETCA